MKLEASTGYEADCSATISLAQWGDLNAIVHGTTTERERQLVAENVILREDLNDARTGWEQATEDVREADEVLAKERALRKKLVNALEEARAAIEAQDDQAIQMMMALVQISAALAAAEAA
jgi:multidrug resistance efflux pump